MKYPDFVKTFRPKGTIVKKGKDTFYVYEAKSKRVPGKNYPIHIISGIIGQITPNGFIPNTDIKIDTSSVRILEYGFTDYLLMFKDLFLTKSIHLSKEKADLIYNSYIIYLSPLSYLKEDTYLTVDEISKLYNLSTSQQIKSIYNTIECKDKKKLEILKRMFMIKDNRRKFKIPPNDEQIEIMKELNIWNQ